MDLAALRYHVRTDIIGFQEGLAHVGGGNRATVRMDRAHRVVGMSNADIPIDADRFVDGGSAEGVQVASINDHTTRS